MEETVQIAAQNVENVNWLVKAFQDGGPAMFVIAAIGILALLLIVERFSSLGKLTVDKVSFTENLFGMIVRGDIRQAVTFCDSRPTPLSQTLKSGLVQVMNKRPDEEIQVAMDATVLQETPKIEGWTGFLAVFGNVSTLVGLFGTIIGLIHSFGAVAKADPGEKAQRLSMGIAEALNCTAFGLIVAIVSIVAYGYFQIRVSRVLNDVVESSMSMMNVVVANREKVKF